MDMMTNARIAAEIARLRLEAERQMAAHPQYAGHWDGWVLGRMVQPVRTKMGLAAAAGDLVLVDPDPDAAELGAGHMIYSPRTRCDTFVSAGRVELLGGPVAPEPTEPVTVGQFTYDPATREVSGPAGFMRSGAYETWRTKLYTGADVVFDFGVREPASNPVTAMLVSLQTAYAGWHGAQTLFRPISR